MISAGLHINQDIELSVSFTYRKYCQLTVTVFSYTPSV